MDHSAYAALNQCDIVGLEVIVHFMEVGQGRTVWLYRDHVGRHRVVLDIDGAGVSGIVVGDDGEVLYKETDSKHRGHNYTRQLQAMLTVWGVEWHPSEWITDAGKACYKYLKESS